MQKYRPDYVDVDCQPHTWKSRGGLTAENPRQIELLFDAACPFPCLVLTDRSVSSRCSWGITETTSAAASGSGTESSSPVSPKPVWVKETFCIFLVTSSKTLVSLA